MSGPLSEILDQAIRALEPLCVPCTLTKEQIDLNITVLHQFRNLNAEAVTLDGLKAHEVEKISPDMVTKLAALILEFEVKYCGNGEEFNQVIHRHREFILGCKAHHIDVYQHIKAEIELIRQEKNWLRPGDQSQQGQAQN